MLRRAFLSLVPVLLALTAVVGMLGAGTASAASPGAVGASAEAAAWNMAVAAPAARGSLTQDLPDTIVNLRADEDDTSDDRIARTASTIVWPQPARHAANGGRNDIVGPSHRPCASQPRAPPTA